MRVAAGVLVVAAAVCAGVALGLVVAGEAQPARTPATVRSAKSAGISPVRQPRCRVPQGIGGQWWVTGVSLDGPGCPVPADTCAGRSLSAAGCFWYIVISSVAKPSGGGLPAWYGRVDGCSAARLRPRQRLAGWAVPIGVPLPLKPDSGQEFAEGGTVGGFRPRRVLGGEHEGGAVMDGDGDLHQEAAPGRALEGQQPGRCSADRDGLAG